MSQKYIYSSCTALFNPAANATDIWSIQGITGKTVRILRLILGGTQNTAAVATNISLIKRSAANTAGTRVASTKVPLDSESPASSTTVEHYTANASGLGAAVGTVYNPHVLIPAAATITNPPHIIDFDCRNSKWDDQVVLHSSSELLVVNLGGGALPSGTANYHVNVFYQEQ